MYERNGNGNGPTCDAAPALDRVADMANEFAMMSPGDQNRAIERLVRVRQAGEMTSAKSPKLMEADRVYTGEASARPRGITLENVDRVFTYQAWDPGQISKAEPVREAILSLARAILRNVPDGPDRSVAMRKLRELRMDVNAAITHRGEF